MQNARLGLRNQRVRHRGMMVAQRIDGDAGEQVGVGLAVLIVERRALAAHKAHGIALAEDAEEVGAVQRPDLIEFHGDSFLFCRSGVQSGRLIAAEH